MSDREPYDRSSWYILVYENRCKLKTTFQDKFEEDYYSYYSKLWSICSHSEFLVSHYKEMVERYQGVIQLNYRKKTNIELKNIEICNQLLSLLESTTPIQNILQRARKPGEVITLEYLGKELPEEPYNVFSSKDSKYLEYGEIQFLNNIDRIIIKTHEVDSTTIEQYGASFLKTEEHSKSDDELKFRHILFAAVAVIIIIGLLFFD